MSRPETKKFVQSSGGGKLHLANAAYRPMCGRLLTTKAWDAYNYTAEVFLDQEARWGYCNDCPYLATEIIAVRVWPHRP